MKIIHNPERCASTGMCEAVAPDLFEIGSDGALVVLRPEPPPALLEAAREAVDACPTGALRLQQ